MLHNVVHSCTHDSPELSKDLSGASIVPQMVETQPWISSSRPVNVKLYLRSASVDMHGLWFSEHLQIQVQVQVKPMFQYQRRNPPLAPHRPIAGSRLPSHRSNSTWQGKLYGLCKKLWDPSVHSWPRHMTDGDDDGQIWAPTPATGSSRAQNWLQLSK